MSGADILRTSPSSERLTFVVEHGPEQWRPVYRAVRDYGVALAMLDQRSGPFRLPTDKPVIAVVNDDTETPLGPGGFNRKSLRKFAKRCGLFVVVSCEALPPLYAAAAASASLLRSDVLLIESQPQFESDWLDLITGENARAQILVGAVKPETESRH